jgi:hypothetical protein
LGHYPVAVRWHYRDPALIWLFLPAYLAHLAEEVWGGFPAWVALLVGRPLPLRSFVMINAVALAGLAIGIGAASRRESAGWFAVAVASALGLNAVLHLAASLLTGTYSPGLITGIVFYVPLAVLTLVRASDQLPSTTVWRGVVAGLVLHAIVIAAALAATRSG